MRESRGLKKELAASLVIQGIAFALGLAVQMLLSRWLGQADYGDVAVTLSVATLGTTLALQGLDRFSSMTISGLLTDGREALAAGFQRFALYVVLAGSLGLAVGGFLVVMAIEAAFGVDEHPVRYAAVLLVPAAVSSLLGRCLAGRQRPLLASTITQLSGRVALLAALGLLLLRPAAPSEPLAVALFLMSWLVVLAILLANSRSLLEPGESTREHRRQWLSGSRSFLVTGLAVVGVAQSGVLVLELLHSDEATTGLFAAAQRTAALPMIALAAARSMAVPRLSSALSSSQRLDPPSVERLLRPYARFLTAAGFASWLIFLFWGDELLSLFGHATERGHLILVLLGFGNLVLLCAGLVGPLLNIHGERRLMMASMLFFVVLAVGLAALAVPVAGAEGVAAAYAISVFVVSAYLARELRRRTGVRYLRALAG